MPVPELPLITAGPSPYRWPYATSDALDLLDIPGNGEDTRRRSPGLYALGLVRESFGSGTAKRVSRRSARLVVQRPVTIIRSS